MRYIVRYLTKKDVKLRRDEDPFCEFFQGGYLEEQLLWTDEKKGILYIGVGEENLKDANIIKELAAKSCREFGKRKIYDFQADIGIILREGNPEALKLYVLGLQLGSQGVKSYKTDKENIEYHVQLSEIESIAPENVERQIEEGLCLGKSVLFVRDMVNMPGNLLRPEQFVNYIGDFLKDTSVEVEVRSGEALNKMGALMTVGGSSKFPPYLLLLRYQGNPDSEEITGLVGKGVTSDTGGYCLKSSKSLIGNKGDMGGAAAVVGTVYALAMSKAKVNVTCVLPICENRISDHSYLPGDVITSYSGTSIEIKNTDAEGRLILADAMTVAVREEKVTRVLDIATLTGSVVGALGFTYTGVLCDNEVLWEELSQASRISGEKFWRLPFDKEHIKMLETPIADIKNLGEEYCGTITAGLFIRHFAENIPWIHLDIAGTAWLDSTYYEYQEKFATGAPVETLFEWLHTA
jgi:leucyl aminopeptidase